MAPLTIKAAAHERHQQDGILPEKSAPCTRTIGSDREREDSAPVGCRRLPKVA